MNWRVVFLACSVVAVLCLSASLFADEHESRFRSLFDGKTLKGWDGDKQFWRVEEGSIVGQTTEDNKAERNTFLIYRPKQFGDFELRFSYQVTGYNSGVQYRSEEEDGFVVNGYQADFEDRHHKSDDGPIDRFSGMFFEERGRMFLGQRGDVVIVKADPDDPQKHKADKIGSVGDPKQLEKHIKRDGWNDYVVIAKGFQFTHLINGHVMAIGIDEHEAKRRAKGILAFQLHSGPPMTIRLKDLRIRELD